MQRSYKTVLELNGFVVLKYNIFECPKYGETSFIALCQKDGQVGFIREPHAYCPGCNPLNEHTKEHTITLEEYLKYLGTHYRLESYDKVMKKCKSNRRVVSTSYKTIGLTEKEWMVSVKDEYDKAIFGTEFDKELKK